MDKTVVLYVEDEEDDVFFMRRAFKQEGLVDSFQVAVDGGEAIAYLEGTEPFENREKHPLPDLILLDLNIPVRSGFDVLRWIRDREDSKETPVIIFSSSGHVTDRLRADELGANAFIMKPSSGLEFIETVRSIKRDWLDRCASVD